MQLLFGFVLGCMWGYSVHIWLKLNPKVQLLHIEYDAKSRWPYTATILYGRWFKRQRQIRSRGGLAWSWVDDPGYCFIDLDGDEALIDQRRKTKLAAPAVTAPDPLKLN